MKINYLTLTLLASLFLVRSNSFAANSKQAPSNEKYIVTGTISAQEIFAEHAKYLKANSSVPDDSEYWNNGEKVVPPYIKFMKLVQNPNYNAGTIKLDPVDKYTFPPVHILPMTMPPLSQGQFGTCATFALLGALGAQTQNGNYATQISPSCALNLSTLFSQINTWDGYFSSKAFGFLDSFGVVRNQVGDMGVCNNAYPTYQPYGDPAQKGQKLDDITGHTYYINARVIHGKPFHQYNGGLDRIKQELNDTTFSGVVGTPGYYAVAAFDMPPTLTWITVTEDGQSATYPIFIDTGTSGPGHEVYIYGYDDNICVSVSLGGKSQQQCGVIFFRNSWGLQGNNGNFLMTYQYFNNHQMKQEPITSFPNLSFGFSNGIQSTSIIKDDDQCQYTNNNAVFTPTYDENPWMWTAVGAKIMTELCGNIPQYVMDPDPTHRNVVGVYIAKDNKCMITSNCYYQTDRGWWYMLKTGEVSPIGLNSILKGE